MASSTDPAASRPTSGIVSPPTRARSRTQSISSDRPSTLAGHSLMSPPLTVSPEAAFIAASAASQIVTNDHDSHADAWYDQHGIEPSGETALVSPAALQLVNNFLDQLLFNFLSVARSTTLTSLRPAVSEVLKPKLAKDAVNQADEELREYLGGGDDDDLLQQTADPGADWDLELVWKRTRLRCMVYSSLGDMEEEDEDYYMEQEHLDSGDDQLGETVSPAVAIFLTSILEFMGEQALIVAGQAAYHRMRVKFAKELKEGSRAQNDMADRIVVEELDMERVALDRTLGRLWRAWKKRIRSPTVDSHSFSRPFSRDSNRTMSGHARQSSGGTESLVAVPKLPSKLPSSSKASSTAATADAVTADDDAAAESKESLVEEEPEEEYLRAAAIPLPMGDRDIAEILIAGLAAYSDDEEDEAPTTGKGKSRRPKSLMIIPVSAMFDLPTPTTSQPDTPVLPQPRKRSNSLPTPSASPYRSPVAASHPAQTADESEGTASETSVPTEATPRASKDGGRSEIKARRRSSRPVSIIANAAAARAAAVGRPPQRRVLQDSSDDDDDEEGDDDFVEEPEFEILTSSRVSISGRSSSPTASEHNRPLSINPSLPMRSGSVHSIRVIDMASPRSPVSRSRGSSVEAQDHIPLPRTTSATRSAMVATPPIVEELRTSDELAPALRSSVMAKSAARGGGAAAHPNESISEAEEVAELTATPTTESISTPASEPRSATRYEDLQSQLQSSQHIFGSVVRHTGTPPQSPLSAGSPASPVQTAPSATKVTILSSTHPQPAYYDERPDVPLKQAKVTTPTLPERSTSRMPGGNSSPTAAAAAADTSSIGVISVDRGSIPKASPELPLRSSPVRSREQQQQQQQTPVAPRQSHAPGSSISSSSTKYKPIRSSEDGGSSMRPEDVARNFEELIHSDQTIQYTLTPESMRDIDSVSVVKRRSEDVRQPGDRSRSSSMNKPSDLKRSTSISRSTGLSSHPVETQVPGVPRSPTGVPQKPRAPLPQAREARVPRESLADFAEFIRATGPAGEPAMTPPINRAAGPTAAVRNSSNPMPGAISRTATDPTRISTSSANRQRYQARDATVDYKDDNSDLIDFIRRGPPSAGNPRIPRTVAPFRTTMDSDQLSGAVGGKAVDAMLPDIRYSGASTNITESSMNSSSALIKKDRNGGGGGGGQRSPNMFDDGDMMPKRKTRRVRDPYALDFSDEDGEEDEDLGPRRPKRAPPQEESLVDFLRSVPPPPEVEPVPFAISQKQARQQQYPKKKASAPSLMARFARASPTMPSFGNTSPRSAESRPTTGRAPASGPPSNGGGGGGRGYIPIQINMPPGLDKYSPQASSSSSSSHQQQPNPPTGGAIGVARSTSRVAMKKFEPREAQPTSSRATSDLADFFRNSGPPGPPDLDERGMPRRKRPTVA